MWESHRVRCTTRSTHPMCLDVEGLSTASPCVIHICLVASFHLSYHRCIVCEKEWRLLFKCVVRFDETVKKNMGSQWWNVKSRSAIHCESRLAIDSSSCWRRVAGYTWYNRCKCNLSSFEAAYPSPFSCGVYSPVTCAWRCRTLSLSSFLWQKGHTVVAQKSRCSESSRVVIHQRDTLSLLLCNCVSQVQWKGGKDSSLFSCGAWKTQSWVSMAGTRDTARQDNMIGLCLFLSSMADSKSAYTTTGAGISYRWLVNRNRVSSLDKSYWSLSSTKFSMYLYFVIMNGFVRSEKKVITEPALCVSWKVFILCIVLSCHTMLEINHIPWCTKKCLGAPSGRFRSFKMQRERGERDFSLPFVHDIACE